MEQKNSLRSLEEFMQKNKERGLLTNKETIRTLKGIGVNVEDDFVSQDKKKKKKSGRLQVSKMMLTEQRNKGAYKSSEWLPNSIILHTDDFWNWINSMTYGAVKDQLHYAPYEKYKAQAQHWINNSKNPHEAKTFEEKKELILEEYSRINSSTLYFSMQYAMFIDGTRKEGKARYVPKEHNAIIFYLLDCGYSFIFGKPRQIFATTTINIYASKKLVTQENFFMKYISMDVESGMDILNDKLKPIIGLLPNYLRPQTARDYNKGIHLGRKVAKGTYAPPNSRIQISAPTKTAINSGSPSVVFVDEIGAIDNLIPMVLETRPTMYIDVNQDGNLIMARQLVLFGTGVSDNAGKEAFKTLWTSTLALWDKKDYKAALFIPLFFHWTARCGEETYKDEQKIYYSGETDLTSGFSLEERKHIFHMHYPSDWTDMFGVTSNKLVSRDIIESNRSRIRNMNAIDKPIDGYFEPVYDRTQPYGDNMYVPYKIIDAKFIAYDDDDFDRSKISAQLYVLPKSKWRNRFYKGTDPVMTETGTSNFASVIWDAEDNLPACILDYRKSYDHKSAFLQSLLMGIYYDPNRGNKKGVPELVENNIGINYKDFCDSLGYGDNFIWNKELPGNLTGGGTPWGVNTIRQRKEVIVSNLSDVALKYGGNVVHDVVFKQLDSYVPIKGSWQPSDRRMHKDDVLDALSFAYICRNVYLHLRPTDISKNDDSMNTVTRWVNHRDANGNLTRIPKAIPVRI